METSGMCARAYCFGKRRCPGFPALNSCGHAAEHEVQVGAGAKVCRPRVGSCASDRGRVRLSGSGTRPESPGHAPRRAAHNMDAIGITIDWRTRLAALLVACVWLSGSVEAHEGMHASLARASESIAREPDDAAGWLLRAELHRLHGDVALAVADVASARACVGASAELDRVALRVHLDADRLDAAGESLYRLLALGNPDAELHRLHARWLQITGSPQRAVEAWQRALDDAASPEPDHVLALATLLEELGDRAFALATLDEGVRRLGAVPALVQAGIALCEQRGDVDGALARVAASARGQARSERWHVQRAEILERAGRDAEAQAAWEHAARALRRLPPRVRTTRASLDLLRRVDAALASNSTPDENTTR